MCLANLNADCSSTLLTSKEIDTLLLYMLFSSLQFKVRSLSLASSLAMSNV